MKKTIFEETGKLGGEDRGGFENISNRELEV